MRPQRKEKDPYERIKVHNKMSKLVSRGYINEGVILILMSLFSVPKTTEDISIVFDTTLSRNNYSL